MIRHAKRFFWTALIFSLATIGVGIYFLLNPALTVSDPSVLRTNNLADYQKTLAPALSAQAPPTNLFAPVSIVHGQAEVTIRLTNRFAFRGAAPAGNLENVGPTQTAKVGQGEFGLKYIGTAWDVVKTNFDYAARLPLHFFEAPDWQPIAGEQLKPHLPDWEREADFRGEFPTVRFIMSHTNIGRMMLLGIDLFDARTKARLTTGYSSSSSGGSAYIECTTLLWHRAPVDFVAQLAYGDPIVHKVPAEIGAEVPFPGGLLKLVAITAASQGGWRTTTRNDVTEIVFRNPAKNDGSALIFAIWPTTSRAAVEIEALGADGTPLGARGSSSSDLLKVVQVTGQPEDIKFFRVTAFTNITRFVFHVDGLPGLPPENAAITNLLDTRIPFLRLEGAWAFESALSSMLQAAPPNITTFPNGYFPKVFTNKTAKELLLEYLSHQPQPPNFKVNNEAGKIELIDPPWIEIWKKLKKIVGK